jgi:hypothetical protein
VGPNPHRNRLAAGSTLLAQAGGGLYWLLPSVLTPIISGLVNAWILLLEIPALTA